MRTVICHFFNEEYMLPWWLAHHRLVFDHGIMIDYNSTDASREIIKRFCPDWEIHATRNPYFDSACIDREVEDYEKTCRSWRMALNVTEFLYGNFSQLDKVIAPTRHFIGNYVFVDPMNGRAPSYGHPLHEQARYGYYEDDPKAFRKLNLGLRASRSLQNYAARYPERGGRHWYQSPTLSDLARKLQIKTKMSPEEIKTHGVDHPNTVTREKYLGNIDLHHRPRCKDLTEIIEKLAKYQYSEELVAC
jgi:hypothetical protein